MNVKEICNQDATTACAGISLSELAALLGARCCDAAVIVASPVVRPTALGIVTYREILEALLRGADLARTRVVDVLDRNPLLLHEAEELPEAIRRLQQRAARHAPVVGAGGTLCGVISLDRLLGFSRWQCHALPAAMGETYL